MICEDLLHLQDEAEFSKNRSKQDGLQDACKACNKIRDTTKGEDGLTPQQRWNPEKVREFRKAKGEDGLTSQQRWNAKNPEKVRENQLKDKYGMTIADFDRLLVEQGGACAICRDTDKKWCVDHDHVTGKVRAILCYCCNIAIGNLGDSARLAAEYLTKHGSP